MWNFLDPRLCWLIMSGRRCKVTWSAKRNIHLYCDNPHADHAKMKQVYFEDLFQRLWLFNLAERALAFCRDEIPKNWKEQNIVRVIKCRLQERVEFLVYCLVMRWYIICARVIIYITRLLYDTFGAIFCRYELYLWADIHEKNIFYGATLLRHQTWNFFLQSEIWKDFKVSYLLLVERNKWIPLMIIISISISMISGHRVWSTKSCDR